MSGDKIMTGRQSLNIILFDKTTH